MDRNGTPTPTSPPARAPPAPPQPPPPFAPSYVLILEEDWLYMDGAIAEQTEARRSAVSRGIEVIEEGAHAYDGRTIMGVFLRPETCVWGGGGKTLL